MISQIASCIADELARKSKRGLALHPPQTMAYWTLVAIGTACIVAWVWVVVDIFN